MFLILLLVALMVPLAASAQQSSGNDEASSAEEWPVIADADPTSDTDTFCQTVLGFEVVSVDLYSVALRWTYNLTNGVNHNGVFITLHDVTDDTLARNDQTLFVEGDYCFFTNLVPGRAYTATAVTVCYGDTSQPAVVSFHTPVCGTVIDGTAFLTYTPMYAAQPYSYHQMVYPSSQVPDSIIEGLSFKIRSGSGTMRARIYMANISGTTLYPTVFVPSDSLQLVADSVLVPLAPGWVSIPFDHPFLSDGRNLLIAVHNITGSSNTCTWLGNTQNNVSLYTFAGMTDTTDIADITFMTPTGFLPAVKFHSDCSGITCLPPNAMLTSIGSTQAHVAWAPGVFQSGWTAEYREANTSEWTAFEIADTGFTFTGLTPDTPYDLRIGALCSSDTLYTSFSIHTVCDPIDVLPWIEDFDSYPTTGIITYITTGDIPCWRFNAPDDRFYLYPHPTGTGRCLCYGNTDADPGFLVLPQFDFYLPSLSLSFWTQCPGFNNSLGVGYLVDPLMESSYVEVARLDCSGGTWNTPWEFHEVTFPDAATGRIALRYYGRYGQLYIDDICVRQASPCAHPEISVDSLGATAVRLRLSDSDSVHRYRVRYSSGTTLIDSFDVSDTLCLLSGLTPGVDYTVEAATLCPGGSLSTPVTTPVTPCGIIEVPYFCDFETSAGPVGYPLPPCWSRTNAFGSSIDNGPNAYDGSGCLRFDGGNERVFLPWVDTTLVDLSQMKLSFYVRKPDNATYNFFSVCATNGTSHFSPFYPLNTIMLFGGNYQYCEIPLDTYRSYMGSYLFFFEWNSGLLIDNLTLDTLTSCTVPALSGIMLSGDSLILEWLSSAPNFNVHYRFSGSSAYSTAPVASASGNRHSLILTGILPDTVYHVYIEALCSDGTTQNSTVATISTYNPYGGETYYKVTATSDNPAMGSASCFPSGTLPEGTLVVATAIPNEGYRFVHWSSSDIILSTDNPYSFRLASSVELVAHFDSIDSGNQSITPTDAQHGPLVLFPNPAHSSVTLTGLDGMDLLTVVDVNGRTVGSHVLSPSGTQTFTLDISALAPGAYFVRLTGERTVAIRKLIVK